MGTHTRLLKTMVLVALCLTLLLAGCAGATRVSSTEKIAAAERAIRDATQSEAAPPDLETARAKLGPARAAAAVLLQKNPKVAVLIEGHTDSAGTDTLNAVLSAKRAESVKQVLVARGVSAIGS